MDKENEIREIVRKYRKGECDREELDAAIKLFDDPYHNLALRPALYEQWTEMEDEAMLEFNEDEHYLILDKIHHRIHLGEKNKSIKSKNYELIISALKVAVILVIGLFLGLSVQYLQKPSPEYFTSIAPKGSISQMILPDNTVVYLNSGSEIKYTANKTSGQREVFLTGEAWFDVSKDEKKPFVVKTQFYNVKVLGTRFNLKAYDTDKEVVTTLEEGSVEILSLEDITLNERKMLKPGQQFIYNQSTKAVKTENVRTRLFTSWKDNKLIFINTNLENLIVLLERKYGVDIEVDDNIVLDYHYDGTIKNESILGVLDLLKETLPVHYEINGQKVIIQKNRRK